ncbi:helicase [Sucra jujuba nucleopolyhedrovirus]|uniref:Helicase n=1 Tax=Sucra jujuba nucleopolyhedrovirus TaxID=1563660 RepID=A0A097P920_9ABAC|nr:helicase [Sucra jujuba nucleopolyhedrovirus]AIU41318.1 helicase [Sucra jujuba nucleopolyhedrovirus]
MAAIPMISVDQIFEDIFVSCDHVDNATLTDFDTVDNLILKNGENPNEYRVIQSMANFQELIKIMSNAQTVEENLAGSSDASTCVFKHQNQIEQHAWYVRGNCFLLMVKPFINKKHYDAVDVDFSKFVRSNRCDLGNECKQAGDYYYWPNISISYFGWRQYLQMKLNIDIGEYVPLIHNRSLGNVNLFDFNPNIFLNVELSLMCNEKKLFVNGRSVFTDSDEDLFEVMMADGSKSTCKVLPNLVYSNKNFFDYIRDDINLIECKTTKKYQHVINVNLKSLRLFKNVDKIVKKRYDTTDRLKVRNIITASSENDEIADYVRRCVTSINEHMVNVMKEQDVSDEVLRDYLRLSNYMNFDYLIIFIWRMILKNDDFDFCETDIRLYLELLCEELYPKNCDEFVAVSTKCEPYTRLLPKVFTRFCNHWTIFNNEDPLESVAYYFAIHYTIYLKMCDLTNNKEEHWNYSYENVLNCGLSEEILCKGFFKKIESANACLVFNGKHYVSVKKEDDLAKFTEKCGAIAMSSVKFNNWKYLYFTEEGVFNLFINDYHSPTPFILGNTLMGALTKKSEKTYLPEHVITYMLNSGKIERDIYKIYHVAKVCRDVRTMKNNMSILAAFDNCDECKTRERVKLTTLFREIWQFNNDELVAMGIYLNEKKMADLVANLKCNDCQARKTFKQCPCYSDIKIDLKAFKIALIVQLFCNDVVIIELVWSLMYTIPVYSDVLRDNVPSMFSNRKTVKRMNENVKYFHDNRVSIIEYMYSLMNRLVQIDSFIVHLSNFDTFMLDVRKNIQTVVETSEDNVNDDKCASDDEENKNEENETTSNVEKDEITEEKQSDDQHESNGDSYIENFHALYVDVIKYLKNWNIWWDKLIVARSDDDLSSWLVRFYMRVILSKMDLKDYSHFFVKNIVKGYLYFRNFTNFNYKNSLLIMHFDASLGIPSDFEKCCIYCTGEPGSGKSSNSELMEHIFVVHKRDADSYTLSKKETDEMEANKLISQLYVINEMKECNDSFFKTTADSTKSNAVCRKYQGSQKYEANFKLMIINNKPLYISNYDKGVRNRFAIINMDHVFEENLPFNGSVYWHIKNKKFPMEKSYYESLVKPVRLFLSHILMYKRNKKDGYISYKSIIKDDPVHNHNLMCLDINNSTINALIYVLKVRVKFSAPTVEEGKVEKMIELAAPYVEIMIHESLKLKRNVKTRIPQLCADFKKRFKAYYCEENKTYCSLTMAWSKTDFNITQPVFMS